MSENTIKIAVWNIYGPPPGKQFEKTAHKIKAFQDEVHPDIAFYLEAPEGKIESLPGIDPRCWKKTFWVGTGQQGNPRGILAVQYNNAPEIKDSVQVEGAVGLGLELAYGTERIQVIGVWTQLPYFESLKNILHECRKAGFLKPDIPCIVVGDTNLNLSARAEAEDELKEEDSECMDNRKKILSLAGNPDDPSCVPDGEHFGLALFPDADEQKKTLFPGLMQNTWRSKDAESLWFRCDLMLVSSRVKIVSAELGRLTCLYKDEERKGYEEVVGSDHRPIIFEVSLTN